MSARAQAPKGESNLAARGEGLKPRPTCPACKKLLPPRTTTVVRPPTAEELRYARAAQEDYERKRVALQARYHAGEMGHAEWNRADDRLSNSYEATRRPAPGVEVFGMFEGASTEPVVHQTVRTGWGYDGNGHFCTLRCGYSYAVAIRQGLEAGTFRLVR